MAVTHVARNIGVSHCTIPRLRTNFNAAESLKDRPLTGWPRKYTANEDRYITLISRRNLFISENNRSVLYQRQEQLLNKLLFVNHRLILFHSEHLLKKIIILVTIFPC